jgi:hypothetical protein
MRNASGRVTLALGGDSGSREEPLTARLGMEAIAITGERKTNRAKATGGP